MWSLHSVLFVLFAARCMSFWCTRLPSDPLTRKPLRWSLSELFPEKRPKLSDRDKKEESTSKVPNATDSLDARSSMSYELEGGSDGRLCEKQQCSVSYEDIIKKHVLTMLSGESLGCNSKVDQVLGLTSMGILSEHSTNNLSPPRLSSRGLFASWENDSDSILLE